MKQIDIKPDEYRKQDPQTGRWLQNVDKKFCRWMSLVGAAMTMFLCYTAATDPSTWGAAAAAMTAFFTGALFTLSLKSIDW